MIASLRGTLLRKDTLGAVVECAGVGYGVSMSLSALSRLEPEQSQVYVLVHTHVTQDSLRLFGFLEETERRAFVALISASGVGPRLALAVLSTMSPQELAQVVEEKDIGALVKIPGVGKKKAERLLVELRDRLRDLVGGEAGMPRVTSATDDLQSALENMGFKPQIAERAAAEAIKNNPDVNDLAVLVRAALRAAT